VTAAFELSAFGCGICRTTLKNPVLWYFWLKKDTRWLVNGSFLALLLIQIDELCRVLRSPQHLWLSCIKAWEHPKLQLPPARAY